MPKPQSKSQAERVALIAQARQRILSLTLQDLQLADLPDCRSILAVLMETGLDEDFVYSLVTTVDGAVSLYFSNGGGTIGLGEIESIRTAAAEFIDVAEHFLPMAHATSSAAYPLPGEVAFYFVTTQGLRAYVAPELELGEERDELAPLFHCGHHVISLAREHGDA